MSSVTAAGAREPVPRRYAIGWALATLGLVIVVAMEAHGAAWSENRGGQVQSLPRSVIIASGVVAGILAVALFVVGLMGTRVTETPTQRKRRWMNAVALIAVIGALSLIRIFFHASPSETRIKAPADRQSQTATDGAGDGTPSKTTWWPLVIVGVGTAAAVTAALVRRKATTDDGTEVENPTLVMLDASLDDLRREPDPRRAVIAAYARMENGLAARGFARHEWETPTEYLQRTLAAGSVEAFDPRPLRELTALAEQARFSALPIDEAMRARAIDALEALRRELRARAAAEAADEGDAAELGRVG